MKKSYWIAGALALLIAGWMASGMLSRGNTAKDEAPTSRAARSEPRMAVQIARIEASPVVQFVKAQGSIEPERRLAVRAETAGKVVEVAAQKGARLKAGDLIVRLAMQDRKARLKTAEAQVAERKAAYDAARKLRGRGYTTQRRVEELFSQLQAARAEREKASIESGQTTVRAPFAGILNERPVEEGDYISVNSEIATLVDADPLRVHVQVPQQDIARVKVGASSEVTLATGGKVSGTVAYVSSVAEPSTRTFKVEIEVPNADAKIPSGIGAEAQIRVGSTMAQSISPAILSLNPEGRIGVKTVTADNRVAFHRIEIVASGNDGIWVTGLPDPARVITVGQGFVRIGDTVEVAPQHETTRVSDRNAARSTDAGAGAVDGSGTIAGTGTGIGAGAGEDINAGTGTAGRVRTTRLEASGTE